MEICFEGIGQVVATFATKDALTPGMAVTMTGNGEVGLSRTEGGGPLCGVAVGAERGGAAAVQIGGVVKVNRSDEDDLDVGWQELACDGKGGVTAAGGSDGMKCLVLAVDKGEKSVVIRL